MNKGEGSEIQRSQVNPPPPLKKKKKKKKKKNRRKQNKLGNTQN